MSKGSKRRFSLKQFKWLIYQSKAVETDMQALAKLLKDPPVSCLLSVSPNLEVSRTTLYSLLGESVDVVFRSVYIAYLERPALLVYISSLADADKVQKLLKEILGDSTEQKARSNAALTDLARRLTVQDILHKQYFQDIVSELLSGQAALFISDESEALVADVRGWESRSIGEPEAEASVFGPRDAFNETLSISISLIRRRIRDSNLVIRSLKVGSRSQTQIAVLFIRDVANPNLIKETLTRLESVSIDRILGAGDVEALIEDSPGSPFPMMLKTERPDKAVSALTEGRVLILVEGTPISLIAPATFPQFFQAAEDYNEQWMIASLIRLTRYFSLVLSLIAPGVYIAIVGFHPGFIPSDLAFTIGKALTNIPFPVLFEALFMEFALEVLQEAGLRLPKPIGPTVGIVGGIVIGEAAVRASLVSPVMVVVIAITAITSYAQASYSMNLAVRFMRVPFMIGAATFGIYGLLAVFIVLLAYLCGLKSFGEPYMAPLAPLNIRDVSDSLLSGPLEHRSKRPQYLEIQDDTIRKSEGGGDSIANH